MASMPGTWLDRRRAQAVAGAQDAARLLGELGVKVVVTGSLARGEFRPYSDVDLVVTACPRHLKYAIEGMVEEALRGLPFDVVYLDELPPRKVAEFMKAAVDASELS